MQKQYDFIVIGAGSGGIAAARRASEYGARVALVENNYIGGTCVNVGCVPKKVMYNAAYMADMLGAAGDYGFKLTRDGFNWQHLKHARDAYIKRLHKIYLNGLTQADIDQFNGLGKFSSANTVSVNDHQLTAPHILIATGGAPIIPAVPGAELGITSDGFFALERQPKSVLIIGAGYIATEFAGVLHSLGSEVTMLLRKKQLLRSFDVTLRETVMEEMQAAGINILSCVNLERLSIDTHQRITIHRQDGSAISGFDCVLWAVGRRPNSDKLNLKSADVTTTEHGFITTDAKQNTSTSGVYAVGDVTGRVALTPVAIAAGRRLSDRLFGNKPEACLDYTNIASVVFSHPPIGTVGLTEQQAGDTYGHDGIVVHQSRFTDMFYAVTDHRPPTVVKLITLKNGKILGCHVVGRNADEIIQGFAVAIKMGATKADFDNTVAIHPTAAEELVTLR